MKVTERKIFVCCSQAVTGGPELLHQLVHELRSIGREAYISYYPFEQDFSCPKAYQKYDAPQRKIEDDKDSFVVIPEAATWIARDIKKAKIGIWWLSVDNYLQAKHQSKIKDLYKRYKSLLRSRLPLYRLRNSLHFTQSYYAKNFLKKSGVSSCDLSDYLGEDHLKYPFNGDASNKQNIVAYNPKKGQRQTKKLMERYPDIRFLPIANMTPMQVRELLQKAKVYIDFGHHPGKDRPPREAAMAGCCIITGIKGSANFYNDVPIPSKYKLNDTNDSYLENFEALVSDIFQNFDENSKEFTEYRDFILNEPELFRNQVKSIFL